MKKINLYIFSRRPEISVGKVRLKKKVGKIIGANIYLYNLLKTIRIFYKDKRINLKICVNPDKAKKEWPRYIFSKIERIPQGKGDIGIKMWNIINYDKKAKIIIGGDIQNIRSQYIIDAWKKLKNLDDFLLKPLGEAYFQWNMQFMEGKLGIEGDLEINAMGTNSLMQKEVRSQRLTMFLQTVQNPAIAPFVKMSKLISELAYSLDLDPDEILNDPEEAAIMAQIIGMQNNVGQTTGEAAVNPNQQPGAMGTPHCCHPTEKAVVRVGESKPLSPQS